MSCDCHLQFSASLDMVIFYLQTSHGCLNTKSFVNSSLITIEGKLDIVTASFLGYLELI